MTQATEDRVVNLVASARSFVTGRNVLVALLAIALVLSYCAGRASKNPEVSDAQYAANQDVIHDTVTVVNDRLRVDTLRLVTTIRSASVARVAHDSAAARVLALSDEPTIPTAIVIPEVKACDVALRAMDSVLAIAQHALADAVQRGDYAVRGLALAETQLKHAKPRFGFRSGLFGGIVVTATLVKVLR